MYVSMLSVIQSVDKSLEFCSINGKYQEKSHKNEASKYRSPFDAMVAKYTLNPTGKKRVSS